MAEWDRGVVYLLHFERPFGHAKHYMGWTNSAESLPERLAQHQKGQGARLMQVIREAGIGFMLARCWRGGRSLERRMKDRRYAPRICPVCCKRTPYVAYDAEAWRNMEEREVLEALAKVVGLEVGVLFPWSLEPTSEE